MNTQVLGRASLLDVSYSTTQGLKRTSSTSSKVTKKHIPRDEMGQMQEQSLRVAAWASQSNRAPAAAGWKTSSTSGKDNFQEHRRL